MGTRIRSPPARTGGPTRQLNMELKTGGLWQNRFMEAGQDAKALFSYPKHKKIKKERKRIRIPGYTDLVRRNRGIYGFNPAWTVEAEKQYASGVWVSEKFMAFFTSAIDTLKVLVIALGAGLGVWGVINLLEGYGNDNPGANAHVR